MLESSEHVDWVDRRNRCDAESISLVLLQRVREDVERANRSRSNGKALAVNGNSERFEVSADDKFDGRSICFCRGKDRVSITLSGESESKRIVTWEWRHDDATCQLLLDGIKADLWQISQAALYDLFFPKG